MGSEERGEALLLSRPVHSQASSPSRATFPSVHPWGASSTSHSIASTHRVPLPRAILPADSDNALLMRPSNPSDRQLSARRPSRVSCKEERTDKPVPRPRVSGKSRDLQVVVDAIRTLRKGSGDGKSLSGMDAATMRGGAATGGRHPTLCTEREAGEDTGRVATEVGGGKGRGGKKGHATDAGGGIEGSDRPPLPRRGRAGASGDVERSGEISANRMTGKEDREVLKGGAEEALSVLDV